MRRVSLLLLTISLVACHSETYKSAYADAIAEGRTKAYAKVYARLVDAQKDTTYAKAYAFAIDLGKSRDYAKIYAREIEDGHTDVYAHAYTEAYFLGTERGYGIALLEYPDFYALAIINGKSKKFADGYARAKTSWLNHDARGKKSESFAIAYGEAMEKGIYASHAYGYAIARENGYTEKYARYYGEGWSYKGNSTYAGAYAKASLYAEEHFKKRGGFYHMNFSLAYAGDISRGVNETNAYYRAIAYAESRE